jgi:hypothetical protein
MTYTRKTRDEWTIYGNYGNGWEEVTTETSHSEARERLKEYRDNEPEYPHKIVKHRV